MGGVDGGVRDGMWVLLALFSAWFYLRLELELGVLMTVLFYTLKLQPTDAGRVAPQSV